MPSDITAQFLHIRRSAKTVLTQLGTRDYKKNKMTTVRKYPLEGLKGHPLSPHQYLSGCGAHRPASTTATPEIKIMSDFKL